jgi:signal peptidase I
MRGFASALSAVIPGAGQFLLCQRFAGIGFLAAFFLLLVMYWPLRLPHWYFGLQFLMFFAMGLCATASWHALRAPNSRANRGSRGWLVLLVPFALLASFGLSNILLRMAGFRLFVIPSSGMDQTVANGEEVIADMRAYRSDHPRRRDVVALRKEDLFFIKRVMAGEGETIAGKDGLVSVDGVPQQEPYVEHTGQAPAALRDFASPQILPGELFVMGDNRDVSIDSRLPEFGLVREESVLGKALYIIRSKRGSAGKEIH